MTQMGEYEASLTANYKAAQARLGKFTPPPRVKVVRELPERTQRLLPLRHVMLEVCEKHGVTVDDIIGHCHADRIVAARQEMYYRLLTETTMNAPALALRLNKEATTIRRGFRKHKKLLGLAA